MPERNRYPAERLAAACHTRLIEAGARPEEASGTVRAMMHGSRLGIDSHGVRLTGYYVDMLRQGGVNSGPNRQYTMTAPATGHLDADFGLAHTASYEAMNSAVSLARIAGIGAVTVCRSTHFGAAGAYALAAAEQGMVGLALSNSDPAVALSGGRVPFHGTNPIAMAAPVTGGNPWLLDMATSSIPFNRVKLYRSLGLELPEDVALDVEGNPTCRAEDACFLQPLGGMAFGHKGAALAGLVTVLSAILSGADPDPAMTSTDAAQAGRNRQNVGHIMIAFDPSRFVGQTAFEAAMARYIDWLRCSDRATEDRPVRAPGDIEWEQAAIRALNGIPVDPDTEHVLGLSQQDRTGG